MILVFVYHARSEKGPVDLVGLVVFADILKSVHLHVDCDRVDVDKDFALKLNWNLLGAQLCLVLLAHFVAIKEKLFDGGKINEFCCLRALSMHINVVSDQGVLNRFERQHIAQMVPLVVKSLLSKRRSMYDIKSWLGVLVEGSAHCCDGDGLVLREVVFTHKRVKVEGSLIRE